MNKHNITSQLEPGNGVNFNMKEYMNVYINYEMN